MSDPRTPDAHLTPSSALEGLSAAEAQALLTEIHERRQSVPTSLPAAFVFFAIVCMIGTFGTLGLHLASLIPASDTFSPLAAIIAALAGWFLAGLATILIFRTDRWQRGMAARWIAMLLAWTVLWVVGIVLYESRAVLIVSPLFIVLFIMAIAFQAQTNKRSREQARAMREAAHATGGGTR